MGRMRRLNVGDPVTVHVGGDPQGLEVRKFNGTKMRITKIRRIGTTLKCDYYYELNRAVSDAGKKYGFVYEWLIKE